MALKRQMRRPWAGARGDSEHRIIRKLSRKVKQVWMTLEGMCVCVGGVI